MNGQGAQIAYLLLAALFMAVVSIRALGSRPLNWRIAAALIWLCLFVGLTLVAQGLGLRPR